MVANQLQRLWLAGVTACTNAPLPGVSCVPFTSAPLDKVCCSRSLQVLILQLSKSHCSATTSWFIVELLSTDGLLASSAVQREREMESETAKGACMCRLWIGQETPSYLLASVTSFAVFDSRNREKGLEDGGWRMEDGGWRMEDGGQKEERRQKEGWKEGMKEGTTTYVRTSGCHLSSTLPSFVRSFVRSFVCRCRLQGRAESREQRGKREREGGRSGRQSSVVSRQSSVVSRQSSAAGLD